MPHAQPNQTAARANTYDIEQIAVAILQRESFNVDELRGACSADRAPVVFKSVANALARDLSKGPASNLKELIKAGYTQGQLVSILSHSRRTGSLEQAVKVLTSNASEFLKKVQNAKLNPKTLVQRFARSSENLSGFLENASAPPKQTSSTRAKAEDFKPAVSSLIRVGFNPSCYGVLMGACVDSAGKFSQGKYDKVLSGLIAEVENPQSGINMLLRAGVSTNEIVSLVAQAKDGGDLVNAPRLVAQKAPAILSMMRTFNLTFKNVSTALITSGAGFARSLEHLENEVAVPLHSLANEVGFTPAHFNLMLDHRPGFARQQLNVLNANRGTLSLLPKEVLSEAVVRIKDILQFSNNPLACTSGLQGLVAEYLSATAVQNLFNQRLNAQPQVQTQAPAVAHFTESDWDPSPWSGNKFEPIDDSEMADYLGDVFALGQGDDSARTTLKTVVSKVASEYRKQVEAINNLLGRGANPDQILAKIEKKGSLFRALTVAVNALSTPGAELSQMSRAVSFSIDRQNHVLKGFSPFEVDEKIEQMYRNVPNLEKLPETRQKGLIKLLTEMIDHSKHSS